MNRTVYHFWSPTCKPCTLIKPSFQDLKDDFPDMNWVSVNTHEPNEFAETFNVRIVPTLVVVTTKNGAPVLIESHTGTNLGGYHRIFRNSIRQS